jgi:hypothetical protein
MCTLTHRCLAGRALGGRHLAPSCPTSSSSGSSSGLSTAPSLRQQHRRLWTAKIWTPCLKTATKMLSLLLLLLLLLLAASAQRQGMA